GVPFDERAGRFPNEEGRIASGLYATGWAKRGPSGTIGTNRPDGFGIAERIAAEVTPGGTAGPDGLDALLAERGTDVTGFDHWRRIDAAEVAAARPGSPREKFVRRDPLLAAARA